MKILFLGPAPEKLLPCIKSDGDQIFTYNEKLHRQFILEKQIELIISYNYRFIIGTEVLNSPGLLALNLHTSLLPHNRGAHPVLWSILERTPLGVTIHQVDSGIDTGPILFQKELTLSNYEKTLRQVYDEVNEELVKLFCTNWQNVLAGHFQFQSQIGTGTYHRSAQAKDFLVTLENSWDTSIKDARRCYAKFLEKRTTSS
jgi:methionyl-tRNA formyltransferase